MKNLLNLFLAVVVLGGSSVEAASESIERGLYGTYSHFCGVYAFPSDGGLVLSHATNPVYPNETCQIAGNLERVQCVDNLCRWQDPKNKLVIKIVDSRTLAYGRIRKDNSFEDLVLYFLH